MVSYFQLPLTSQSKNASLGLRVTLEISAQVGHRLSWLTWPLAHEPYCRLFFVERLWRADTSAAFCCWCCYCWGTMDRVPSSFNKADLHEMWQVYRATYQQGRGKGVGTSRNMTEVKRRIKSCYHTCHRGQYKRCDMAGQKASERAECLVNKWHI